MDSSGQAHRDWLDQILLQSGYGRRAAHIFTEWPNLERVAAQLVLYLSPWLVIDEMRVVEKRLAGAIRAYENATESDAGQKAFIAHIAYTALDLARHRVSVQDSDGYWMVWDYDQPLTDFLQHHNRSAIQVRIRENALPAGPVMIKLLAAISTTLDMAASDVDLPRLLEATGEAT